MTMTLTVPSSVSSAKAYWFLPIEDETPVSRARVMPPQAPQRFLTQDELIAAAAMYVPSQAWFDEDFSDLV